ncbi:U-box domain-containing protein 11 [Platanthera guangdongensis]|uniref:U-box domain-containing protein 11 n=1 Tax=Platanthera guangdongensis TaxID=2320717 RepID=A0ABR2M7A1_9ASPA
MTLSPEGMGMAAAVLTLAREIAAMGTAVEAESLRLSRKVSLLIHLLEEINNFAGGEQSPSPTSCLADLALALEAVKKFLLLSAWHCVGGSSNLDSVAKKLEIQYQYVTWKLEKVLSTISYEHFQISDEVQEEVELVRSQLRREIEKNGPSNLNVFEEMYNMLHSTNVKELKRARSFKLQAALSDSPCSVDRELRQIVIFLADVSGKYIYDTDRMTLNLMDRLRRSTTPDESKNVKPVIKPTDSVSSGEDDQKSDSLVIPEDFLCPISLDRMRDPVIVSTGQTYERSSIQRWIDCGNQTCPKTRQKLDNLTLTTNYVLRSLIVQWCEANEIKQPRRSVAEQRSSVASCKNTGERSLIGNLVYKLTRGSTEEQRSAAAEVRFLAKRMQTAGHL